MDHQLNTRDKLYDDGIWRVDVYICCIIYCFVSYFMCLSKPRQHLSSLLRFQLHVHHYNTFSIVSKSYYNEKEARDVCEILFKSIGYIHERSIAHRDLKPENLLLLSEDDDSQVKIADFGFAKKCLSPNSLTTQCGTPGYVAPEILEGVAYDTKSDMWSLGVIIYILLGGYPPFIEQNQRELFRKIRRGQYEFHEEYWGSVSADAKDLISKLLTVDPAKRLSAEEALKHKWMVQDGAILAAADLGTNLTELRKYNAKRKFKAAVNAVSDIHME